MNKLELKNLCLHYGDTKILNEVNLSVCDNEFMVLVGPSGSGKSTILRAIAGLETPSSGEISIDGKCVNDLHPKNRDIAMVFQNYALYPHLTIFDNIAFPLKMKKVDKKIISDSVHEISELLGLRKYLNKKPKELSGGERQRVALGRAIIRKPKLFLMDEPLSNLDAKLRTQMRTELLKIQRDLKATVVYVTHDQIEALTMGDKITVLSGGEVQQIETPENIYNSPSNLFVAGFIGNPPMNFLKINNDSSEKTLNDIVNITAPESDVVLGIRPEKMYLGKTAEIVLKTKIELVEMLGNEYLVHAVINQLNTKITLRVQGKASVSVNDEVEISFSMKDANFFSSETGKLLGQPLNVR